MNHFLRIAALALALTSGAAAAGTSREDFLQLAAGSYEAVSPSHEELGVGRVSPQIIVPEQGEIRLINALNLGGKHIAAQYAIKEFGCAPGRLSACKFVMELKEMGTYVHFLGLRPAGNITERNGVVTIEIYPDYFVAGHRDRTPSIVVQRSLR